jgi:hypothetical protein
MLTSRIGFNRAVRGGIAAVIVRLIFVVMSRTVITAAGIPDDRPPLLARTAAADGKM